MPWFCWIAWGLVAADAAVSACGPIQLAGRSCFDGDQPPGGLPWCYASRFDETTNGTVVECPWGVSVPVNGAPRVAPATCGEDGTWRTPVVCEAAPQTVWRVRNDGSLLSGWWVQQLEFSAASCRDPPPIRHTFSSSRTSGTFSDDRAFDGSQETGWHSDCTGGACLSYIGVVLLGRSPIECVGMQQFTSSAYRADNVSLEMWESGAWRTKNSWTGLQAKGSFQILESYRECRQYPPNPLYKISGVGVGPTPHGGEGTVGCADGLMGKDPITVYCNNGVWHPEFYDLKCVTEDEYYPLEGVQYDDRPPLTTAQATWQQTSWLAIFAIIVVVLMGLGCVVRFFLRRHEGRKRRAMALLRARVKHFEDLFSSIKPGSGFKDEDEDLEKPRHLRPSADERLSEPFRRPGQGKAPTVVGKARAYTATSQGPMDDGLLARGQPSTKQVRASQKVKAREATAAKAIPAQGPARAQPKSAGPAQGPVGALGARPPAIPTSLPRADLEKLSVEQVGSPSPERRGRESGGAAPKGGEAVPKRFPPPPQPGSPGGRWKHETRASVQSLPPPPPVPTRAASKSRAKPGSLKR